MLLDNKHDTWNRINIIIFIEDQICFLRKVINIAITVNNYLCIYQCRYFDVILTYLEIC